MAWGYCPRARSASGTAPCGCGSPPACCTGRPTPNVSARSPRPIRSPPPGSPPRSPAWPTSWPTWPPSVLAAIGPYARHHQDGTHAVNPKTIVEWQARLVISLVTTPSVVTDLDQPRKLRRYIADLLDTG